MQKDAVTALKVETKQRSYTELAYDAIKELIIQEDIEPGELLSEMQLAQYLKMSRTPVREAVRRLEADGILESKKGIGTFVKNLSLKDIRDIYEVREALEAIASTTAIQNIDKEETLKLKKCFLDLQEKNRFGEAIDRVEFTKLDTKIHDLIITNSTNEFIKLLMDKINFFCLRYRMVSIMMSEDLEESTIQHLCLMDCILAGDAEKLHRSLKSHIKWSLKILQENLIGS